jgi:multicomponent K+:H+ antiporter subunit G
MLHPALALLVALLVVLGALAALIGSVGLLRLKTFYERIHPPTMGTTLGLGLTLIASMVLFSGLESRPVLHEIVIAVFVVVTTPVTFMLLVRAALHRDRGERDERPASGAGK